MDERVPDREREDDSGSFVRGLPLDDVPPPSDFLQGVQGKIRRRSRGKFFRYGWSTSPSTTIVQIVSLVMLLALVLIWMLSGPVADVRPDSPGPPPVPEGQQALPPMKIQVGP